MNYLGLIIDFYHRKGISLSHNQNEEIKKKAQEYLLHQSAPIAAASAYHALISAAKILPISSTKVRESVKLRKLSFEEKSASSPLFPGESRLLPESLSADGERLCAAAERGCAENGSLYADDVRRSASVPHLPLPDFHYSLFSFH